MSKVRTARDLSQVIFSLCFLTAQQNGFFFFSRAGSVSITDESSSSVTLQLVIRKKASDSSVFSEVDTDYLLKDYIVLCNSAVAEGRTGFEYMFFDYVLDADIDTSTIVETGRVPIQERVLSLEGPELRTLRSEGSLECRLVCGATQDVLSRVSIPSFGSSKSPESTTPEYFVSEDFHVVVEKHTFIQSFAVMITGEKKYHDDYLFCAPFFLPFRCCVFVTPPTSKKYASSPHSPPSRGE